MASTAGDVLAGALRAVRAGGGEVRAAFGPAGYDTGLLRAYGPSIAGMAVYMANSPFELGSPAVRTFQNAMNTYAPEASETGGLVAMQAYLAADLFLRGLAAAGPCPSRAGFIGGLRQVADYTAGGLLAEPVDLRTNLGRVSRCLYFVRATHSGAAFEVMPGGDGPDGRQWCGQQLGG
ncbi:conserved hypothetical protein [Frankia canadensis]|uniref:Leucine-binding protein domain-containing protein n=1 Tax=Frankia canadensis TaxID=1836972 RepID=A0A2I2KNF8_9ACTN|nr:ABC transporter substrate-binding protein [Frankia canadensis]SNQ47186.1 conserved hypothetical protein [Frankia canadensis]SOU54476.1 conserved hypothetical protein [Frankia canadensis]